MRFALAVLALLVVGQGARAQEAPEPLPQAGRVIVDPDFRVETRQFGLDRRVEMLQWRRDGAAYQPVWNEAPIDSGNFDTGYRNPGELPIEGERWWSTDATLNGKPLAPEVLRTLGQWRQFRPGFQRLPANLAATFQPDGDGLSSSENPLDPQVGDLRITWRELTLPPLLGKVELRDGVWHPVPAAAAPATPPVSEEPLEPADASETVPGHWWLWGAGGLVGLALVTLVTFRRRRRGPSANDR
ncbi:TMEM43 family protein [Aerolutibacter ruishenii]|uniref:Uncharacterized protein DUF1625 n=1 Tax=Aerolutibacter ruishenii TaxID=686800 RepID=A0A562LST3_9GAMM|nr:TMEM43 family protein [Lysobacter ruishenii]TWI10662.1 uncharacterized protein DUF1625 [Lysobacter ruishenii]